MASRKDGPSAVVESAAAAEQAPITAPVEPSEPIVTPPAMPVLSEPLTPAADFSQPVEEHFVYTAAPFQHSTQDMAALVTKHIAEHGTITPDDLLRYGQEAKDRAGVDDAMARLLAHNPAANLLQQRIAYLSGIVRDSIIDLRAMVESYNAANPATKVAMDRNFGIIPFVEAAPVTTATRKRSASTGTADGTARPRTRIKHLDPHTLIAYAQEVEITGGEYLRVLRMHKQNQYAGKLLPDGRVQAATWDRTRGAWVENNAGAMYDSLNAWNSAVTNSYDNVYAVVRVVMLQDNGRPARLGWNENGTDVSSLVYLKDYEAGVREAKDLPFEGEESEEEDTSASE